MTRDSSAGGNRAAARLFAAWRGEVEARAVYEALAARERDPKRAAALRHRGSHRGGGRLAGGAPDVLGVLFRVAG